MADIVAIGEALIEFSQKGDGYLQGFGGDTSNCVIAAARQGGRCAYITMVGSDEYGDLLVKLWDENNVSTEAVLRHKTAPTGSYYVDYDENGKHHFRYCREGSAANYLMPEDLPKQMIQQSKILHLSSISQAISHQGRTTCDAAIRIAKQGGTLFSYDTNLRLALWSLEEARNVILSTLESADILMPSFEDTNLLTGLDDAESMLNFYRSRTSAVILLTMGERGVWIDGEGQRKHIAGQKVDNVDANGAGDTFDGTFLWQYLQQGDIFAAAKYANTAAALSTCTSGAVASIPTAQQVKNMLGD